MKSTTHHKFLAIGAAAITALMAVQPAAAGPRHKSNTEHWAAARAHTDDRNQRVRGNHQRFRVVKTERRRSVTLDRRYFRRLKNGRLSFKAINGNRSELP